MEGHLRLHLHWLFLSIPQLAEAALQAHFHLCLHLVFTLAGSEDVRHSVKSGSLILNGLVQVALKARADLTKSESFGILLGLLLFIGERLFVFELLVQEFSQLLLEFGIGTAQQMV